MADNTRLRAIGQSSSDTELPPQAEGLADEPLVLENEAASEVWVPSYYEEDSAPSRNLSWLPAALALLAIAAWTGFFGWANHAAILAGVTSTQWLRWIADWSMPVALMVGVWLLAMRNSRREASRFSDAAQSLAIESERLELRLSTVNRELSLARDFIAAQSRDLESLGRVAADRLSQNADRLQGLIRDNGEQVEAIGRVSTVALTNMDRLRDDLPVIANSARDVTSQIGQAGEVARGQLEDLVGGFNRLNEFGEASGRQVVALQGKVDEAVAGFDAQAQQLEVVLGQRFAALTERSTAFRAELDGREVETFAAMRRRADALSQEVLSSTELLSQYEQQALDALLQRMTRLSTDAAQVSQHLREGEADAETRWGASIADLEARLIKSIRKITEIDLSASESAQRRLTALREEAIRVDQAIAQRIAEFDEQRVQREAELVQRETDALAALEHRLAQFDGQLTERQQEHLAHVSGLTERSEALAARLRELSQNMDGLVAQGLEAQGGLSEAAVGFKTHLAESRTVLADSGTMVARLTDDSVRLLELIRASADHGSDDLPRSIGQAEDRLTAFESQARALSTLIAEAGDRGAALADHVATARQNGTDANEQLNVLDARMNELAARSEALAGHARGELSSALTALQQAADNALGNLQTHHADAIRAIADRIGTDSSAAIAEALRGHADTAIADLEASARSASEVGRETAIQLRDQLSRVNELAGNLEQRVAHARQRAEEQVDDDFAKRMALITESLNSNAIDISKAFAAEVTDIAWASYLRGDRGIFTRRAVRLLDNHEARGVAEIYQNDADFRETVNRYIHDFEAMLRSVLSTRDGHALAVTLLSSDMGKLYVALAQAIDRLRS